MKRVTVHDPYRNIETSYAEFARNEGCKMMAVYLYNRRHGTLEGFRERPKKGNGIKPHTFSRNGEFISVQEAHDISKMSKSLLGRYSKLGITDIEEIMKIQKQRVEDAKRLYPTDDGRMVTQAQYARERSVTYQTVAQYVKTHGTLVGFTSRGHSRYNPKQFLHEGRGESKSAKGWAAEFGCSVAYVKIWAAAHDGKIDGLESRKMSCIRRVEWNGRVATLTEWARILGVPKYKTHNYYHNHGTLEGFGTRRVGRPRMDAA